MAFFDDLSAKLTLAGQKTMRKANELGDTAKLNLRNNELNRANQDLYGKLGMAYFGLRGGDPDPELSELCDAINRNLAEMEHIRQEIQRIKQIRVCKVCGAENPSDARFCASCSAPLYDMTAPAAPVGRVCPVCGNPVGETAMFCTHCGNKLAPAAPAEPVYAPQPPENDAYPAQEPAAPAYTAPAEDPIVETEYTPAPEAPVQDPDTPEEP